MRTDPRAFADDINVEMRDAAAARLQSLDREGDKAVGRRATPARIAGREMRANVAVGQRAENGIDHGMQDDVGVGVPNQAPVVRDANATEYDMIAGIARCPKGVHVEAAAG